MHPENQFEGFKESMSSWIGCSLKWVLDEWVKDSSQMSLGEESTCFDGDGVCPFMLKVDTPSKVALFFLSMSLSHFSWSGKHSKTVSSP